jgi:hypothetical protein
MSIDVISQRPTDHLDLWLEDDPSAEQLPDVISASLFATIATVSTFTTYLTYTTFTTFTTYSTGYTSVQSVG